MTLIGGPLWWNMFEMRRTEVLDYWEDVPLFQLALLDFTGCATDVSYSRANAVVGELR